MPKFFIKINGSRVLIIVALVYVLKIALSMPTDGTSLPISQVMQENIVLFAYGLGGILLIVYKLINIERDAVDTALCVAFNVHLILVIVSILFSLVIGLVSSLGLLSTSYTGNDSFLARGTRLIFNILPFILTALILVLSFRKVGKPIR